MPLRRQTRPHRVEQWDDPPPCWFLRPRHHFTLFEGEKAAGRPHVVGVDWWGRVWDNDPARQPPPYPGPEAAWREVAYAVHALLPVVTDVWWAVLPQPGEVHAHTPPTLSRRVAPPTGPPPASLTHVFGRISAALSSCALPRRRSAPWVGGCLSLRPPSHWRTCSAPPPPPPHAAAGAAGGSSSDPVADAPSAPSPSQSSLPPRRHHGGATTEET